MTRGARACREFHRKKLAKRLLSAGQVDNAEESFLQRLKSQYGAQFISKMEGMCSDLNTARAKQQDFTTWLTGLVRTAALPTPPAPRTCSGLVGPCQ